ncbi:MAG: DNA replication/repair protein RecF [Desulfotomaculaceae bacterium]|nr:DNA replication/repair protein RecF [Desulfotomaculaceae bacterium]
MYLKQLELNNFRNYRNQVLEPGLFLNILTGQNAQGKTNILEAIYMACIGNSFRTSKEKEIINWESDFSYIHSLLQTEQSSLQVNIFFKQGFKKIEVNGSLKRGSPLGWPGLVLFTADDLVLVKGSPQERRRFLDLELGPFNTQYGHSLASYNRVLAQRNNLLREIRQKREEDGSLQVWDEQLCRYGSKILHIRLELLKKFSPLLRSLYRELTGGKEDFDIRYKSSLVLEGLNTEDEIYRKFQHQLYPIQAEEIDRAQSLLGPHRDDLVFFINGRNARIYGSQGQQRTIVLTLKIAQIDLWKDELDEYPILLLDDVIFELDNDRRQAIFRRIGDMLQTFLTTTKTEDIGFSKKLNYKTYMVSHGEIIGS